MGNEFGIPMEAPNGISLGDRVTINHPVELVQLMQVPFGGWNEDMRQYFHQVGTVMNMDMEGSALVTYEDGRLWRFNSAVLSKVPQESQQARPIPNVSQNLGAWDVVRLNDNLAELQRFQEGHGGWNVDMDSVAGKYGTVKLVLPNGDLRVRIGLQSWTLNWRCCAKLTAAQLKELAEETASSPSDARSFELGDIVRVQSNEDQVRALQVGHGEWSDSMRTTLGQIGYVKQIFVGGELRVNVQGRLCTYNPAAIVKVVAWNWRLAASTPTSTPSPANAEDPGEPATYRIGDSVTVRSDKALLTSLQKPPFSPWNDLMEMTLGKRGTVVAVLPESGIKVKVPPLTAVFSPEALIKAAGSGNAQIQINTPVRILPDPDKVKQLQQGHGGWNERMVQICGKVGKVVEVIELSGDLRVKVMNSMWTLNPLAVERVSNGSVLSTEAPDPHVLEGLLHLQQQFFQQIFDPFGSGINGLPQNMGLLLAAQVGDVDTVKMCLDSGRPIDQAVNGHTALHVACFHGHVPVVQLLLQRGARKDFPDSEQDSNQPVHVAALRNQASVLNVLNEHGVNVNAKNAKQLTPLHMAAAGGHVDAGRCLVECGAELTAQDAMGETPLHLAVECNKPDIVRFLLRAGDDITTANQKGFTAFHLAARRGNTVTLKLMLQSCSRGQQLTRDQKPDGFNSLHLCAYNGQTHACRILLEEGGADVDTVNNDQQTALHLAVISQSLDTVTLLVENKADVNRVDGGGDSPLHEALRRHMRNKMRTNEGGGDKSAAEIAVYLSQHGANMNLTNNEGKKPLELCADEQLNRRLRGDVSGQDASQEIPALQQNSENGGSANPGGTNPTPLDENQLEELKSLKEKLKLLTQQNTCAICLDRQRDITFQCGHGCCDICANHMGECHVCRQTIEKRIPLFL